MVKLTRLEDVGPPVIIGLRWPGWLLGAASVVLERAYAATAGTLTHCRLRHIRAEEFRHLVTSNAQVSWQLHQLHSREVYQQTVRLSGLGALSARRRLEQFLWELILAQEPAASNKPVRMQLPLKWYELAQFICVTPQYVSQLLGQLEQEGVLRRSKGWLIIPEAHKLWHRREF